MKKIASVLIAIMLSLPFLSSTVSAEEASAEVVKVERFDIVTDMEELKELSQQQKQQRMQQRSAPMKDEDSKYYGLISL